MTRRSLVVLITFFVLAVLPAPAWADATAFWGFSPTPKTHPAQGFAVGIGLLVLGFEFEYAGMSVDTSKGAPSLTTGSFNGLVQTPTSGFQLYATAGGGLFREQLLDDRTTSVSTNIGGGAKIALAGPIRIRVDYRVFSLRGGPIYPLVKRFYAGVNIKF